MEEMEREEHPERRGWPSSTRRLASWVVVLTTSINISSALIERMQKPESNLARSKIERICALNLDPKVRFIRLNSLLVEDLDDVRFSWIQLDTGDIRVCNNHLGGKLSVEDRSDGVCDAPGARTRSGSHHRCRSLYSFQVVRRSEE